MLSSHSPVRSFARRPLTIALRAVLLGAGVSTVAAALVATPAVADAAIRSYDIPAGALNESLNRLASQAGITLSYEPALVGGRTAPALKGSYSVADALTRLLLDSGLEAKPVEGGFRLQQAPKNPAVTLTTVKINADTMPGSADSGYRASSAHAGVLGNKKLQDAPYSIAVVSRESMDNRQARSISDVLKTDASVTLSSGDLISENNTLAIRGQQPDGDTGQKLDGMNLRSRGTDLPLEHIETVEVLKGASGFLYGFGTPGGVINYTLKRPTSPEPVRTLSTQLTDSGLWLLHGDLGQRFGNDDEFGYRLNAVHESGDTYIDDGESRRGSASLALDWRITPDLVWQVDALKASHERFGGYWAIIPNGDGVLDNWAYGEPPKAIRGDKRIAPEWTRYESQHETYGTDVSWKITDGWQLKVAWRSSDSYRLFYSPALFVATNGDYSALLYNYNNLFESDQGQAMLLGEFETGPIRHDLVLGVSHTKTVSSSSGPLAEVTDLGSGNLADPVEFARPGPRQGKSFVDTEEYSLIRRKEWFVSDTLHIGSQWDVILGARYGNLEDDYGGNENADGSYEGYDESEVTPTLAVIYRPVEWISLYASYVEALEEGAVAPDTVNNPHKVFEPLVSDQREVGIKIERERWSMTAAIFQLHRGLAYTTPDNYYTQDGETEYEGVEIAGTSFIGRQWLLTASALWLDATNKKTDDADLEGEHVPGAARNEFRLYSEYRVPATALTLSAGAQYVGKRNLGTYNEWQLDSLTLLDAGARYETAMAGKPLTVRLNVDNLTNEDFWLVTAGYSDLSQGAPRTVKLGATVEF